MLDLDLFVLHAAVQGHDMRRSRREDLLLDSDFFVLHAIILMT